MAQVANAASKSPAECLCEGAFYSAQEWHFLSILPQIVKAEATSIYLKDVHLFN